MLSYESELVHLRDDGVLPAPAAGRLLQIERREIFSIYWELRLAAYLGVLTLIAGLGTFLTRHYEEIGPMALIIGIGALAALCYWFSWKRRDAVRAFSSSTTVADYVLLLAALLVSADLGFAESQFHLFGDRWSLHLLLLAVLHGATAYVFRSRMTLSVALTALAAWFGIEQNLESLFESGFVFGARALLCGAVVFVWRMIDSRRTATQFTGVFDHAAANLGLLGAVTWSFTSGYRPLGILVTLVIAAVVFLRGLKTSEELLPIYAALYSYVALSGALVEVMTEPLVTMLYFFVTIPLLVIALFVLHRRMRSADER